MFGRHANNSDPPSTVSAVGAAGTDKPGTAIAELTGGPSHQGLDEPPFGARSVSGFDTSRERPLAPAVGNQRRPARSRAVYALCRHSFDVRRGHCPSDSAMPIAAFAYFVGEHAILDRARQHHTANA